MIAKHFSALMNLAKDQHSKLTNNHNALTLLTNKVWNSNKEVQELFITNLVALLEQQENITAFIHTPQSLEFIYYFMDEHFFNTKTLTASTDSLIKISSMCLNLCFFAPRGIFQIIKTLYNKEFDFFLEIFLMHIKPSLGALLYCDDFNQFAGLMMESFDSEKTPRIILENIIDLLNYFTIWIKSDQLGILQARESEICVAAELLFDVFYKFKFIYATFPDLKVTTFKFEFYKNIQDLENHLSLLKNGGVFFTMLSLLFGIFSKIQNLENKLSIIKLISVLVCSKSWKKSQDTTEDRTWKKMNMIQRIEFSNKKLISELNIKDCNTYFGLVQQKNLLTKPVVSVLYRKFYGYIYKCIDNIENLSRVY